MSVVFSNRLLVNKPQNRGSRSPHSANLAGSEHIPEIVLTTAENLTITNLSVATPLEDSDELESLSVSRRFSRSVPLAETPELGERLRAKHSIFRKISQQGQSDSPNVVQSKPIVPISFRECLTWSLKVFITFILMIDILLFYFSLKQVSIEEEMVYHLRLHVSNRSSFSSSKLALASQVSNKTALNVIVARYQRLSILQRPLFGSFPLEDHRWNRTSLIPSGQSLDKVTGQLEVRKSHFLGTIVFAFTALPVHFFGLVAVTKRSVSLTFTHTTLSIIHFFLEWLQLTPATVLETIIFYLHLTYPLLCGAYCYLLYDWKLAR